MTDARATGPAGAKAALRRAILAARAGRPSTPESTRQLGQLLNGVARVASYSSMGTEPSTTRWHAEIQAAGIEVLLPRLRADGSLELAPGPTRPGLRGTEEPVGDAVAWSVADLVVVPALAVVRGGIHAGMRLGRGGGSYDRVLPGVRSGVLIVALLAHPEELLDGSAAGPAGELRWEAHDVRVHAVALPQGLVRL